MSNYRTTHLEQVAQILKALSNPNRLSILMRLAQCCAPEEACAENGQICACVGELGQDLRIASSTVSHHVKELCRAGLIRVRRRGQHVECWIDRETLRTLAGFLLQLAAGQSPGGLLDGFPPIHAQEGP